MEGTWLARIPISPDSAGMLTWTLLAQGSVSSDDSALLCSYMARRKDFDLFMAGYFAGGVGAGNSYTSAVLKTDYIKTQSISDHLYNSTTQMCLAAETVPGEAKS